MFEIILTAVTVSMFLITIWSLCDASKWNRKCSDYITIINGLNRKISTYHAALAKSMKNDYLDNDGKFISKEEWLRQIDIEV